MFFPALLFFLLIVSRCSAQMDYSEQDALTTSTISSTEMTTDLETSFRTSTKTTTSRHSVIETDASTVTTGVSQTHTKIDTYSSIPTEFVTETSISTSTIDLTEQPPPPTTTTPPLITIVTVAPKPSLTCCSWPKGSGPYTRLGSEITVDDTCLAPKLRTAFHVFINQDMTNEQFCAQSTSALHDFFQGRVFDMACNAGEDPKGNRAEFEANQEEYINCFNGFMETLCGFHDITNTGKGIDSICGKNW